MKRPGLRVKIEIVDIQVSAIAFQEELSDLSRRRVIWCPKPKDKADSQSAFKRSSLLYMGQLFSAHCVTQPGGVDASM
jgi:hypothetical protein